MANTNPDLQAKLRELDHELEEGDITQKGSVNSATPIRLLHSSSCPAHPYNATLTGRTATKNEEPSSCRHI